MADPRPSYWLVVQAPNGDVREVELDGPIVIGRDESADVRVADKKVSRRHAAFRLIDGQPYVEDLGSSNGVKVDGARIEKRARIDVRSDVRVGGYQVRLREVRSGEEDPTSALPLDALPGLTEGTWMRSVPRPGGGPRPGPVLVGLEAPVAGQRFELRPGENVVGRLDECDVIALHPSVSRQHARIVVDDGRVEVHDLGSANGVFVGDRPAEVAELADGDVLRVGEVAFRVELPPGARRPRPLEDRVAAPATPPDRRGLVLGSIGLLAAAVILGLALVVQRRTGPGPVLQGFEDRSGGTSASVADARRGAPAATRGGTAVPGALAPAARASAPGEGSTPPPGRPDDRVRLSEEGSAPPPGRPDDRVRSPGEGSAPPPGRPDDRVRLSEEESAPPPGRPFGRVRTATAPWSPRGPDGLPLHLPAVDPTFDHAAFVAARLASARTALEAGDRAAARAEAEALLDVDPIHEDGRALLVRLAELEAAEQALGRADALVAADRLAEAYRILSEVPLDLPSAEAARARAAELRPRALANALRRAKAARRRSADLEEAHRLYRFVLELEPTSTEALEGLRTVERAMRKRNLAFEPWRSKDRDPAAGSRAELGPVLDAYVRGEAERAIRMAQRRRRRARGETRAELDRQIEGMKRVTARFSRVRTEIANDPSQAWAMLIELEEAERGFLPRGRRSYIVDELRADLSDAFAREGEGMFATERHEAAFQRWEAGHKLDPTNARVVAGLARLERLAQGIAEEARVAARRGANADACERFRAVTRITRSTEEVHRQARKRAFEVCP